jgi:hypothetical protein
VLHFAMASCRDEATALLIADSGINLSIAVNKPVLLGDASAKHSLLHLASMRGWSRMAERLVAAGVPPMTHVLPVLGGHKPSCLAS